MNPFDSETKPFQIDQVAFFDLDHTLCKVNTSFCFGIYLLNKGVLPFYKVPYLMLCYFLCKIGFVSLSYLHQVACRQFFLGKSLKALKIHVDSFLDTELNKMLNVDLYNRFENAKLKGCFTILLSNSPDFLVLEIAKRLGFNESAGTEYSVNGQGLIGEIKSVMDGEDKALYVDRFILKNSIQKNKTTGYSDSSVDLLFLESVGNPIAVNPDKKLREIAIERHWTII